MISWIFGKKIRSEIKSHFGDFQLHLSHSFLNIKNDIANIHSHLSHKDKRILELEDKIKSLEHKFFYMFQQKEEEPRHIESAEKEINVEIPEDLSISDMATLTYTQQAILKALYELQIQLDGPISFKSLAQYLYPGKKYSAVRTTLSEYIDFLSTYGFAKKDKIGRETVANITKKGQKLAKELVKKKKHKMN